MTTEVVCGYGVLRNQVIEDYVEYSLKTAKKIKADTIIFSGGNTGKANGLWKTEAEMMSIIAEEVISSMTGMIIEVIEEEEAWNTLGNMLYSKWLIDNKTEKIVVVCNRFHLPKVIAATIRVFGLKRVYQRISFRPFPLTTGKVENLKILAKTVPEVIGYFYFFRPLGRRIEYKQWKRRTGRNEQLSYKEFCLKFRKTGELI